MDDMNTVITYLQRHRDPPSTPPATSIRSLRQGEEMLQRLRQQDPILNEQQQQPINVNMIRAIGKQLYHNNTNNQYSSISHSDTYQQQYPSRYPSPYQYQSDDYDSNSSPYTITRTISSDSDNDNQQYNRSTSSYTSIPSDGVDGISHGQTSSGATLAAAVRGSGHGQKRQVAASSSNGDNEWIPKKCKTDLSSMRASDLKCDNQVVIDVGYVMSDSNQRIYYVNVASWFDHPVEVYTAVSDTHHRMLFRASVLADKFGCATNTISMFLQRLKQRNPLLAACGLYQATGFTRKPRGRIGLKAVGYFITMEVCEHFQTYWMKQLAKNGHRKSMATASSAGASLPTIEPVTDDKAPVELVEEQQTYNPTAPAQSSYHEDRTSMNQEDIAAAIAAAQEMLDSYNSASQPAAHLYNNDDAPQAQQEQSYYQPRQSSLQLSNPYTPYPPTTPSAPVYSTSEVDDVDPLAGVSYSNQHPQIPPQPSPSFNGTGYVAHKECIAKKPSIAPYAVTNPKLLATQMQYSTVGVVSNSPQFGNYTDKSQPTVTLPNEYQCTEDGASFNTAVTQSEEPLPTEPLSTIKPSESEYSGLSDWLTGLCTDLQQRGLSLRLPSMPLPPRISSTASSLDPFKSGSVYDISSYNQWDESEQMHHLVAMR